MDLLKRYKKYCDERFPLLQYSVMVFIFAISSYSFSLVIYDERNFNFKTIFIIFIVLFLLFMQLRIADDIMDLEKDKKQRPYRPLPRGLLNLGEIKYIFSVTLVFEFVIFYIYSLNFIFLFIFWLLQFLMFHYFFLEKFLKRHLVLYLLVENIIVAIIDLFITSFIWLNADSIKYKAIFVLFLFSILNSIMLEFGRKIRTQSEEENNVETYSAMYGLNKALTIESIIICSLFFITFVLINFSKSFILLPFYTIIVIIVLFNINKLRTKDKIIKKMEINIALLFIINYLMIGVIPFILR